MNQNARIAAASILALLAAFVNADGAAAAETGRVFVSNNRDNTVSVLDGKTFAVIKTVDVGNRPQGMALTPDGRSVLVVSGRQDRLDIIDVAGLASTGSVAAGG